MVNIFAAKRASFKPKLAHFFTKPKVKVTPSLKTPLLSTVTNINTRNLNLEKFLFNTLKKYKLTRTSTIANTLILWNDKRLNWIESYQPAIAHLETYVNLSIYQKIHENGKQKKNLGFKLNLEWRFQMSDNLAKILKQT